MWHSCVIYKSDTLYAMWTYVRYVNTTSLHAVHSWFSIIIKRLDHAVPFISCLARLLLVYSVFCVFKSDKTSFFLPSPYTALISCNTHCCSYRRLVADCIQAQWSVADERSIWKNIFPAHHDGKDDRTQPMTGADTHQVMWWLHTTNERSRHTSGHVMTACKQWGKQTHYRVMW